MQTIKELCIIALLAFSSAFFIGGITIEKVEAKACAPGYYSNHGVDGLSSSGKCTKINNPSSIAQGDFGKTIISYYNPIAGTLAAASILTIIYAAYKMITSSGNPRNIAFAKKMLLAAGVSIIVILSSYTIMRLIMSLAGIS